MGTVAQLAACVDMSVELSEAALSFIRSGVEAAAAKAQVELCARPQYLNPRHALHRG